MILLNPIDKPFNRHKRNGLKKQENQEVECCRTLSYFSFVSASTLLSPLLLASSCGLEQDFWTFIDDSL